MVWTWLRDYRAARARMLTEHFTDYGVREGGVGAGTVIGYRCASVAAGANRVQGLK